MDDEEEYTSFLRATVPEMPQKPSPEVKVDPLELMQRRLEEMEKQQQKSASEAHRKISALSEQNQILNQTLQDYMTKKMAPAQSTGAPGQDSDWEAQWNQIIGGEAPAKQNGEGGDRELEPEEIKNVVRETMGEIWQESEAIQRDRLAEEQMAVEKFRNEEKDLHPYAQEVVEIWKEVGDTNPNLSVEAQYKKTMAIARKTLLRSGSPGAPANSNGERPRKPGPVRPLLPGMDVTGDWSTDLQNDQERQRQARKALEQDIIYRRQQQARRMGVMIPQE